MAGSSTPPNPPTPPGLADFFNLFSTNNPLTNFTRSVDQFRQTMESMNSIAKRVDGLLDDIEGPLRAIVPQLTKTAEQASTMMATLSDPIDRVAPALTQLAETLSSPMMTELPRRLSETVDTVATLPKVLAPLGQMAEMAGGLFGGMRSLGLPGLAAPRPSAPIETKASPEPMAAARPVEKGPAKKTPAKKATAKKSSTKRAPAKKTAAKKTTAKKTTAKKTTAKRTTAKKAAAKKAAAKKATGRTAKSARATFARSAAKSGRR
jgi:hypothetical protein